MPKLVTRPPKYAFHKASGQAVVKINGKVVYLGRWNTPESKIRYQDAVRSWADGQASRAKAATLAPPQTDYAVAELLSAYCRHAEAYYRKGGKVTSTVHAVRSVAKIWKELFAAVLVRDVGPSHLKAIQQRLVKQGQSRRTINHVATYSKTMFRWAVENDLCPAGVWQSLLAVRGLAKGRTKAREPEPILPVADDVADATTPYLPPVVQDMVALERVTGARPGEVCAIRPCDIDRSADVWLYRPESHKCEHHDRGRTIAIGPKAQAVLLPYLLRESTAYCFSPSESEARRSEARREARQTPITPSQAARKPRRCPRRSAKDRYTKDSYRRAVARAIVVANEARQLAGAEPLPHWHPNQLRHSMGTDVRQQFGLEAAQCILGHAKADTTQIYAERDLRLAVEVARKIG